jgi:superfamily I DNA/RNA helicase
LKIRNTPVTHEDLKEVRVLTIHGAKGAEADTVYLHTGITPKIKRSIAIPGPDSEAEARVWYVGITRAKHRLYLVKDKGKNYGLPVVS